MVTNGPSHNFDQMVTTLVRHIMIPMSSAFCDISGKSHCLIFQSYAPRKETGNFNVDRIRLNHYMTTM